MKTLTSIFTLALAASLYAGCSTDPNTTRGDSSKIVEDGSCTSQACGGQSTNGGCWCDAECAFYGDCCLDAAEECQVDECVIDEDCGRDRTCAIGATCAAVDCPPPPPNNCYEQPPPPPGSCETDQDCYLWSNTCDCSCNATDTGSPAPMLACDPNQTQCFIDPCFSKQAVCEAGMCQVGTAPPPSCGTCFSDQDCVALGLGSRCTTSNGECMQHCGCQDGEFCIQLCAGQCTQ